MQKIALIIIFSLLPIVSPSQSLEVLFDYAIFKYSADTSLVEIYYSLLDTTLVYSKIDNESMQSRVQFQAVFTHRQNGSVEKYSWDYPQSKLKNDSNIIYSLFGVQQIYLPRGDYKMEILSFDMNHISNKYEYVNEINIHTYDNDKPALSMIELAGIIETKSEKSQEWNHIFQKGEMYIIPNPPLEYSSDNPNLKFYFETYNTQGNKSNLEYQVTILDGAKREAFKTYLPVWTEVSDHGRTLSVPLDLLPTGVYYIKLNLVRHSENLEILDESIKKFYFFNQFIAPQLTSNFSEDQLFEMSEFATLTQDKVELEFRKARVIASQVEIKQWDKLSELIGKQRFLYRFWSMRDEDTTTILNEFKVRFDENVEYSNTFFAYGKNREGWNTDRGRVLLKYGPPTQLDRYPQKSGERPYEEWFFAEIQGGVHFQFVDVMGFGNFILVNSTAMGEIKNNRWFQDYVQNQKSGGINSEDNNINR